MACAAGYICYYVNSLGPTEGTMGRQAATDGNTVTLIASNFSREGYGFAGWSDSYDYDTNPNAHIYGPNEDITVPTGTTTNGLSLYAVWVRSEGYFQNSTATIATCNGLTPPSVDGSAGLSSVSALTDQRDGQTYAIAKLADGNCWMIENLRLDNTAQLTTLNTNNPLNDNDPTNPTVTLKHNYTDTATYNTLSATSSVTYNADTAPDGWCTANSAACDDQSRLRTDNTANRVTYTSGQTMSTGANLYSYGNYYNWYSATAGRGTYGKSSGSTDGDLCPVGWHLPTGTSSGEFYNLNTYANAGSTSSDANLRIFPNNFLHSGFVGGGSLNDRGSYGYYWSSTSFSSVLAYYLYFNSTYVGPGAGFNVKYYGWAIRCMVSPPR